MKKLLLAGLAVFVLASIPMKMQSPVVVSQNDAAIQVTQTDSNHAAQAASNIDLQLPIATADASASEWIVNGQIQYQVPNGCTLLEMLCWYMIAWCDG